MSWQQVDKRSLKCLKRKLGPPDYYPQKVEQKETWGWIEDELTLERVKEGYRNWILKDQDTEYPSALFDAKGHVAKNPKFDPNLDDCIAKVMQSYTAILAKKQELNVIMDKDKKKIVQHRLTNLWHASTKPSEKDKWFRDLAGSKSLSALAKRFPVFKGKEEILANLAEFNISMNRAAWFVKMTAISYAQNSADLAKRRNRQPTEPPSEWTRVIYQHLSGLLSKLGEHYTLQPPSLANPPSTEITATLAQWSYLSRLAKYMFEEGLLERQEFLTWMLDTFLEKAFNPEKQGVLKLYLHFLMQFTSELTQSENLSRRLAYLVCRKLALLASESPKGGPAGLKDKLHCPHHRHVVLSLSALIQAVMLDCPTALVWNFLGERAAGQCPPPEAKHAWHCGSPLDALPCSPSHLPIPEGDGITAQRIRKVLQVAELEVMERSQRVEGRWSSDKSQQSGFGWAVPVMVRILEELDQAKVESEGVAESLYSQLFSLQLPPGSKEEDGCVDWSVVKLLCHWASSSQREGTHRALLVVRLLQLRLKACPLPFLTLLTLGLKELEESGEGGKRFLFQSALQDYLDTEAPIITGGEEGVKETRELENLVRLYSDLIRNDLFSHDRYLTTLIARGNATSGPHGIFPESAKPDYLGLPAQTPKASMPDDWEFSPMDGSGGDPSKVDLSRSLALLENEEAAGSPGSKASAHSTLRPNTASLPRHVQYMLHFPVPQDEAFRHECNQRATLVFGFGTGREAHRVALRKYEKELSRLWGKKAAVKVPDGARDFRPRMEIPRATLQGLATRFKELCYYDQEVVAGWAMQGWLERLGEWERGERETLPSPASLDFLLGLFHGTSNAAAIIDFADEVSEAVGGVEERMRKQVPGLAGVYGSRLALVLIGFLRAHYAYTLLCPQELHPITNRLAKLVSRGSKSLLCPGNSWQRGIAVFLTDVARSCPSLLSHLLDHLKAALGGTVDLVLPAKCQSVTDRFLKWKEDKFRAALNNPKLSPLSNSELEELRNSDESRYSFVINALLAVINTGSEEDKERLWELSNFLADVTTLVSELAPDWLGAFNALCLNTPSLPGGGESRAFAQLLTSVNVTDLKRVMEPLGTLLTTLVARSCFHPENVLAIPTQALHSTRPPPLISFTHQAFVSYIKQHQDRANPNHGRSESGLHFTLFLINSLLSLEAHPLPTPTHCLILRCVQEQPVKDEIKESSDDPPVGLLRFESERFLLSSTHRAMHPAAILTFLMASILASNHNELMRRGGEKDEKRRPFHLVATDVLEFICGQDWIKQKFLYEPQIFTEKMLLSNKIGDNAPRLLRMITRRALEWGLVAELRSCEAKRDRVEKLLSTLNIWNLRPTILDLELFLKQSGPNQHETAHALEVIARSTMDLFHNQKPYTGLGAGDSFRLGGVDNLWLIAPLMKGLPDQVQGKVLETGAQVLETGQPSRKSSTSADVSSAPANANIKGGQSAWLLGQEPFLCLVLTCLKGQEEQRESLLKSLLKQLRDYVDKVREDPAELYHPDSCHELHEAILLRLSLVGGMLETVCRGKDVDAWGLVLLQLIFSGILTLTNNKRLFYTCLDMLNVIIHSLFVPDSVNLSDRSPDDTKKIYNALNKKLRKEVGDRYQPSLKLLHQLLPPPKPMVDIVATEPYGTIPTPPTGPTSKGALKMGSGGPSSPAPASPAIANGRPVGLRAWEKQRISPWDLVEGLKGREPWNWSWFTTQRLDWAPQPVAASLARLIAHSHYHNPAFPPPPIPGSRDPTHKSLLPLQVEMDQGRQMMQSQQLPAPPPLAHQAMPMHQPQPNPGREQMGMRMGVPSPMQMGGMAPHPQVSMQQNMHPAMHHPQGHPQGMPMGMGMMQRQESVGMLANNNPHMAGLMRSDSHHLPPHMAPHPGMEYEGGMMGPGSVRGRGKRKSTGGRSSRKKTATPPTPQAPLMQAGQPTSLYDAQAAYQQQPPHWQQQRPPQPPPQSQLGPSTNSKEALQHMLQSKARAGQTSLPPQPMDINQQRHMEQQMTYQRQQQMQREMGGGGRGQMGEGSTTYHMAPHPQQYYQPPPNH